MNKHFISYWLKWKNTWAMRRPMVSTVLDGYQKSWDDIITCVFVMLYFYQHKQKSLQAFEATLAASYSSVQSEGWCYRPFRQKYFFVLKVLTYCTMLWGSRLRNPTFAWLQDLQYIAICHFLSRNPSTIPTLTCHKAVHCPCYSQNEWGNCFCMCNFINILEI